MGSDGFDAEEVGTSSATVVEAFDRSSLTPMRTTVTPAAAMRSTVERPVAVEGRDPHGFDAEDDDEIYPPPWRGVTIVDTDEDEEAPNDAHGGAAWDDEDGDGEGEEDEDLTGKGPEDEAGSRGPRRDTAGTHQRTRHLRAHGAAAHPAAPNAIPL